MTGVPGQLHTTALVDIQECCWVTEPDMRLQSQQCEVGFRKVCKLSQPLQLSGRRELNTILELTWSDNCTGPELYNSDMSNL